MLEMFVPHGEHDVLLGARHSSGAHALEMSATGVARFQRAVSRRSWPFSLAAMRRKIILLQALVRAAVYILAKNGKNGRKRCALRPATLRVPERLEIGDQRRAEVAERLLARV